MEKLSAFIRARLYAVPGSRVTLADFYAMFLDSLPARERPAYPKAAVVQTLRSMGYVIGRSNGNQVCIGNLAFTPGLATRPYVQFTRDQIRRTVEAVA